MVKLEDTASHALSAALPGSLCWPMSHHSLGFLFLCLTMLSFLNVNIAVTYGLIFSYLSTFKIRVIA